MVIIGQRALLSAITMINLSLLQSSVFDLLQELR